MNFKDLNDKQKAFAKEYVVDWNGTRAYQKVYPDCEYNSAKAASSLLLTNINIKAYIEHIQKDLLKLCGVSVLGNVMKLKEIIEDDLTDKPSDKIKALEVINRMLGLNLPDKSENVNVNKEIPIATWVDGTDDGAKQMDDFNPEDD